MPSPSERAPLRCRVFGHKWGVWMPGGTGWHVPNWGATRGSMIAMAECKRCAVGYADAEFGRRQTLADLQADFPPAQPDRFPDA